MLILHHRERSNDEVSRSVTMSNCEKYRGELCHIWEPMAPPAWLGWIMLNPSTADAMVDDPTIRRCRGFAQRWGFTGMKVCNLFTWRATQVREMMKATDPIGPGADTYIMDLARDAEKIVLAWGRDGQFMSRGMDVVRLLQGAGYGPKLFILGRCANGEPLHPLYVPGDKALIPYQ